MNNPVLFLTADEPLDYTQVIHTRLFPSGDQLQIIERVMDDRPPGFARFVTSVQYGLRAQTPKGPVNLSKSKFICVPGATPEEALNALPELMKQASRELHEEIMAEVQGPKLVLPGGSRFDNGR